MVKAKYPLAALLTVRAQATSESKLKLAQRIRDEAARRAEQVEATARLRTQEASAQRAHQAHQCELHAGILRAGDLALRAGAVYVEQKVHDAHLFEVDAAAEREATARRESAIEQARLAGLRAAEEVVRLDQERFELQVKKVQYAREEEAAEEAWRKRR